MIIIKVIIIIIVITIIVPSVQALESTSSSLNPKIIEEFEREVASKAAELKQLISKKLQNKAYIGKIKNISPSSLTITASSSPKIVNLNQDTFFESKVKLKKKLSQKNLGDEDFIIALGDIDETEALTAKKIIVLPEPKNSNKTSLWGQVIAIDKITTIQNGKKNIAVVLPKDSKVKLNEHVILTGFFSKNEIFEAEFLYIIPKSTTY